MEPDEVMLRNARDGDDITPPWRKATPEEAECLARATPSVVPDPCPYVAVREFRDGLAVEVGLKGTF